MNPLLEVGNDIVAKNSMWNFSGSVPGNFDNHVNNSVPLYKEGHQIVVSLSDFFLTHKSVCYDIGCSTGSLLQKLAAQNSEKQVLFYGIDNEEDMITYANNQNSLSNINFLHGDILDMEFKKADLIIAYYTMQFIRPKVRQLIFNKIYESLNWGGAFILFEKVRANDARFQDIFSSLYVDFKIDQGFKPEEIIAKSKSLKGVLEPFSSNGNQELLQRAGFVDVITAMKYLCFEGFLAIK